MYILFKMSALSNMYNHFDLRSQWSVLSLSQNCCQVLLLTVRWGTVIFSALCKYSPWLLLGMGEWHLPAGTMGCTACSRWIHQGVGRETASGLRSGPQEGSFFLTVVWLWRSHLCFLTLLPHLQNVVTNTYQTGFWKWTMITNVDRSWRNAKQRACTVY